MKILYLSDDFGWHNYGIKRSLFEELQHRNIAIEFSRDSTKYEKYTHVFFASSGLSGPPQLMHRAKANSIKLIGFGFSDPRTTPEVFPLFTHYITLDPGAAKKAEESGIASLVQYPCIKPGYHDNFPQKPDAAGIVFLGRVTGHPDAAIRSAAIKRVKACLIDNKRGDAIYQNLAHYKYGLVVMSPRGTVPKNFLEYAAAGLTLVVSEIQEAAKHTEMHLRKVFKTKTRKWLTEKEFLKDSTRQAANHALYCKIHVLTEHTIQRRVTEILEFICQK